eukprot:822241-Rhodomonas_salina.2
MSSTNAAYGGTRRWVEERGLEAVLHILKEVWSYEVATQCPVLTCAVLLRNVRLCCYQAAENDYVWVEGGGREREQGREEREGGRLEVECVLCGAGGCRCVQPPYMSAPYMSTPYMSSPDMSSRCHTYGTPLYGIPLYGIPLYVNPLYVIPFNVQTTSSRACFAPTMRSFAVDFDNFQSHKQRWPRSLSSHPTHQKTPNKSILLRPPPPTSFR